MNIEMMKSAVLGTGPTNPFAVAYLQLCQVSYLPPAEIPDMVAKVPPLNPGGGFRCVWGPAENGDQANLVFVAVYDYAPGLPVFASVVIRGTDVDISDGWGIIEQIWEDLDVAVQVPLPWDNTGPARVAQGTRVALDVIQELRSGGQPLLTFLRSFLADPANHNPALVVTGHSLGGCLVSVVAPWLKVALGSLGVKNPIVPASFAAPTAGNAAFAAYYDSSFSYSLRFNNTLDAAPFGWWDISAVETLYEPCGLLIPDLAYIAILGWEDIMYYAGVSYAQPQTGDARLKGHCYGGQTTWYDELAYQHHTTTYMKLLDGASVTARPEPRDTGRARPRDARSSLFARFGSTAALRSRR